MNKKRWVPLDNYNPILTFELTLTEDGLHTKRIAYTFSQALSAIGGFARVIMIFAFLGSKFLN
jgi:hypothetical protein